MSERPTPPRAVKRSRRDDHLRQPRRVGRPAPVLRRPAHPSLMHVATRSRGLTVGVVSWVVDEILRWVCCTNWSQLATTAVSCRSMNCGLVRVSIKRSGLTRSARQTSPNLGTPTNPTPDQPRPQAGKPSRLAVPGSGTSPAGITVITAPDAGGCLRHLAIAVLAPQSGSTLATILTRWPGKAFSIHGTDDRAMCEASAGAWGLSPTWKITDASGEHPRAQEGHPPS
jgi:hypothetical protein